ncbi:MAG: hypothetical protein ACT4OY_06975 [Alphaproteobacteria bacterium]
MVNETGSKILTVFNAVVEYCVQNFDQSVSGEKEVGEFSEKETVHIDQYAATARPYRISVAKPRILRGKGKERLYLRTYSG